jgi:hypothetical protein
MAQGGRFAEAYAKAEAFDPPDNMKSRFMGPRCRVMTSCCGSFMGTPATFIVDQDMRTGVELWEVFYSDHFLSALTQAVHEAYPGSGNLALQFSAKTGVAGTHDEIFTDCTVGVFVFCRQTRELLGTVGINALRRTARAFLASPAARI